MSCRHGPLQAVLVVAGLWGLACSGGAHPVPAGDLPMGTVYKLGHQDHKAFWRLRADGIAEEAGWELTLEEDGRSAAGGESLTALDAGGFLYCGHAFDPELVAYCWSIDEQGVATRLAPPAVPPEAKLFSSDLPHFAADGSYLRLPEDDLTWSPSRTQPDEVVKTPLDQVHDARYAPATGRFVVTGRANGTCQRVVMERDGALVEQAAGSCWKAPLWNRAGNRLASSEEQGVHVWTPGATRDLVLPSTPGPDGKAEHLHLIAWSPDGEHLLLKSSRHREQHYNPCAGVYNPVYDTYVLQISTGQLTRVADVGSVAVWIP